MAAGSEDASGMGNYEQLSTCVVSAIKPYPYP